MSRATYKVCRPTTVGLLSRGAGYSVRDLGGSFAGYTDLLKRELGVSCDADGPQTRWTQLHELSHVRHSLWSPALVVKRMAARGIRLSAGSVLAAEDARINEMLVRRVPDAHKGFKLTMPAEKLRRDIEGYAASHASPKAVRVAIWEACDTEQVAQVDAFLARLSAMPDRELTLLRVTVPLAQLLERIKSGAPADAPESKSKPAEGEDGKSETGEDGTGEPDAASEDGESKPGDDAPDAAEDEDEPAGDTADGPGDEPSGEPGEGGAVDGAEPGDDAPGDAPGDDAADAPSGLPGEDGAPEDAEAFGEPDAGPHEPGEGCAHHLDAGDGPGTRAYPWIVPTVVEPALTVPMRGGNFTVTTAETGTAVRWQHGHRIMTDGVVFRRARRRPGALQRGTVLIDVSGSMHFTDKGLTALVEMLPHATVAVYSGTGSRAWIVVVGRNGRRVRSLSDRELVPQSTGNTCDGPALLWLSRQAAPRLWVCDGIVTGRGDVAEGWQYQECAAIMQAAGIVQVCGAPEGGLMAVRELTRAGIRPGTQERLAEAFRPVLTAVERGRI